MAFTGTTYSDVTTGLDEIARILRDENTSLANAKNAFSNAMSRLDTLLGTYSGIDTVAANLLAADSSNVELQATNARVALLISNRNALRARAEAMQNAVVAL